MEDRIRSLREAFFAGTHKQFRKESLDLSIVDGSTSALPYAVRKAMAFEKALEVMPVYIQQGELIVGGKTVYTLPDYATEHEKETGNPHIETRGYDNLFDQVFNLGQDARGFGIPNSSNPAYYRILPMGLPALAAQAEEKRRASVDVRQANFYQAAAIALEAAVSLMKRYEKLAEAELKKEDDGKRRAELQAIASNLRTLEKGAPQSFWQALQLLYFIHFLIWVEGGYLVPLGRIDQYLYPYYQKDIESGRISRESALELLECMFIKLNFEIDRTHGEAGKFESDTGQSITLGGIDPKTGWDATNDLTYLCIDVVKDLRLTDPKLHLRLSGKSPHPLWKAAADLSAMGMGFPTYDNDDAIIPAMMNIGDYYTLEDARDYCGSGCWEIITQGRSFNRNLGMIDCLRALEWALNNGENILPPDRNAAGLIGGKWGVETGNVENFETFDDLFNVFKVQIKHNIDMVSSNCNKAMLTYSPFYSSMMDDCMENGKDIRQGGCRYNETDFQLSSLSNCADALYAIRKLVYEDGRLSLRQLVSILRSNYEGNEELRQEIISRLPKFGNDVDEVDLIAKRIVRFYSREVSKHRNNFGEPYRARVSSALGYVALAKRLGASADGRKAGEFYASNISPQPGADKNGPTAIIRSAAKIDPSSCPGGEMLDLKFHPSALKTDESKEKFIALIKTHFALGGLQTQVNVIDNKTLLDAKAHPENYRDLMVRVWGFSTYFVSLPEEYQDHLIARTEQGL
ncbi:MAG: pyruvate formate lyase family protein [Clostridia bacterium]|nr:pyruvate formate lyase family protein [Clostridia bacterium]